MEHKIRYDRPETGKRIRQIREFYGISRKQMAKVAECTVKHYADIERGYVGMSLDMLLSISQYLVVSMDYILLGKGKKGLGAEIMEYSMAAEREKESADMP